MRNNRTEKERKKRFKMLKKGKETEIWKIPKERKGKQKAKK